MVEIMTVEDIAGWDEDLQALTDGLGRLFNRPEPRVTFGLMVRGLLADVPKKNSWGLAEHLGLATPQPLEHLLGGARWDVDVLRDAVRGYVLRGLADPGRGAGARRHPGSQEGCQECRGGPAALWADRPDG